MTRKDYEVLADALAVSLGRAKPGGEYRGVILAGCDIIRVLEQDNPRFNRQRFVERAFGGQS